MQNEIKDRLIENISIIKQHNERGIPVKHITKGKKYEIEVIAEIVEDVSLIIEKMENKTLIELPCKNGDIVYKIENNTDACRDDCPYFSSFYGMDEICDLHGDIVMNPWVSDKPICDKQFYEIIEYHPDIDWIFNHRKEFGRTLFLTREEAEKALKEKQNESNVKV